jgi:N-acetylglucosaminyldiphosphoundecaprenol N-acetyl-beta-D-mannosaminyltransferase
MRLARPHLEAPLLLGVGAVFDFASGRKRRAPDLLQLLGLEWVYRLAHEPRRLGGRYLTTNTSFTITTVRSLLFGGR